MSEINDRVWVNGRSLRVPGGVALAGKGPRVVVRFTGPVSPRWPRRVVGAGGAIEFWCPPFGACVTLAAQDAAERLRALPFVAGFVPYAEELCDRRLTGPGRGAPRRWLDVVCFASADRPQVVARLRELGAVVLDEGRHTKIRIDWHGDPGPVRDVIGVKVVERPRLPRLAVTGLAADIDYADADGAWLTGLDGRGEVVAVADTGLDTGDPASLSADIRGRVNKIVSWPVNASWTPFVSSPGADDGPSDRASGHGTYVAGVVLGDGAASGGRHRGVAPKARLVFQAMEQWVAVSPGHPEIGQPAFALAGRPIDIRELFLQARDYGARIHVNAWGTPVRAAYDNDSYEADLFLHEHRDALVLCAAGNEGRDVDGNRRLDPGFLDSPATAKNVLTVGATEGSSAAGFPGTWAQLQAGGKVFANVADQADQVAGQPDRMALLSSAGPTADGRIKPDVCAPGTDIVGLRSSLATGKGWGLVEPAPHYMADGGTSAAVAVAGGFCALLRQAWRGSRRGRALAGATLKALAVLGAAPVHTRDGSSLEDRAVAGFGRIDLGACVPRPAGGGQVLVLADSTARTALVTGQSQTFPLGLPEGGRLRAVLCWYDVPGEHVVNDLDLSLTGPGHGSADPPVWGNHLPGRPTKPGGPDRVNTVEVIDVDDLAPGTWALTVSGANVPDGPQPFSLAVCCRAIS